MGSVLVILIVYIMYFLFSVNRYDKNGHYKDKDYKKNKNKKKKLTKKEIEELKKKDYDKLPNEAKFFVSKYRIDLDKVNIRGLLKMLGLVLGICIAAGTLIVITALPNHPNWQIVIAFIIVLVLFFISMKIMGRYFEKKGLVKDE